MMPLADASTARLLRRVASSLARSARSACLRRSMSCTTTIAPFDGSLASIAVSVTLAQKVEPSARLCFASVTKVRPSCNAA